MQSDDLGLVKPANGMLEALKPYGIDVVDLDMLRRGDKLDKAGAKFYAAIERLVAERDEAREDAEVAESRRLQHGALADKAFDEQFDRAETAEAQLAKLKQALKPFAEAADSIDDTVPDRAEMWEAPAAMETTAGDFHRARQALGDT